MRVKLIITYILNIIDLIATMFLIKRFGLQVEGNPFGRWLIETGLVYFVKIFVIGIALWILWLFKERRIAKIVSTVSLLAYSIITIYHVVIIVAIVLL